MVAFHDPALFPQCTFIDAESGIGFDPANFRFTRMHEQIQRYLERSGPVWTWPPAAIWVKLGSRATCQATVTTGPRPEPGSASSVGVTRVQSRIPSGNGSPDATPCRNGLVPASAADAASTSGPAAATAPHTVRSRLRPVSAR